MSITTQASVGVAAALVLGGIGIAARSEEKAPPKTPLVAGSWTGTWGPYLAPKPGGAEQPASEAGTRKTQYPVLQRGLDCKVAQLPSGEYEATFEGECGRPYKYTLKMTGRAATGSVLFKGTTDLGEKDGGVYDWIGRATDQEFLGFYTSGSHTRTFTLARPK